MRNGRVHTTTGADTDGRHGGAAPPGPLGAVDRAVVDALLDPWMLLRPVRDGGGAVVDFEYVDMNRRSAEFAAQTRVRLLGRRLVERRPELRGAGLVALLAEVVETGTPLVLDEHPYPAADPTMVRRFDIRASLVGTDVALTWRDVTERFDQRQRFELLVNNVADVVLLDRDGILEWVSPNVFGLLGWTPEEITGRLGEFLVHPADRAQLQHARTQSRAGGGAPMTLRLRILRRDGNSVWCATQARTLPDHDGTGGVSVVVSLRDISARILVEQERDASEALYRLVAENVSDVVYTADTAGMFTWVSPSVEGVLGWAADELVGRSTQELLYDAERERMRGARAEVFERHGRVEFERLRIRRRDGGLRWMTLTAHGSEGPDGTPLAVVSLRDVEEEMAERQASDITSAANALVAVAEDEVTLLRDMCEMTVGTGGYRFAWYGRRTVGGDAGRVAPAASSTEFAHYLDGLVVSTGGGPYGRGPTGVATRTGRSAVSNDLAADPDWTPWSERALAHGFRASAGVPVMVDGAVDGVLVVFAGEPDAFDAHRVAVLEDVASVLGNGITRLRDRRELRHAFVNSIDLVAAVVESRDPYTAGHQALVAELARAIGTEMGVDEHSLNGLSFAARIHDVGKIGVPIDLLCRPGQLADEELAVVRRHATMGWEIAGHFDWPWPIAEIIHQHHEHFDGSGYPQGLVGDEILLESRIIAVADTYQAVASRRPYRAALGTDRAREIVESGSGTVYDPEVVQAFLRVMAKGFTFSPVDEAV